MSTTLIHQAAQTGFSKAAEIYQRGRPDYPDTIVPWLQAIVKIGRGQSVIDIGAGTGKFTQFLIQTGAAITALEPVESMRQAFERQYPDIVPLAGTAERIPCEDGAFDAAFCAQAFHWFATKAALIEIHRILKQQGRLALVWNARDETIDWVAAISDIIRPYEGDTPRFRSGLWKHAFDETPFSLRDEKIISYEHRGSPETVIIDRIMSVSFMATLTESDQKVAVSKLRNLITSHPELKNRSEIGFPYQTKMYLYEKR